MTELGSEQTSDTWNQEGDMCWVFIGCGCGNSGYRGSGLLQLHWLGEETGTSLWLSHTLTLGCLHEAETSSVIVLLHLLPCGRNKDNQPNNLKVIGKYNVESFTNISSLLAFQSNWQEVRIRGGSSHDGHDTWHDVMTPRNTSRDTAWRDDTR